MHHKVLGIIKYQVLGIIKYQVLGIINFLALKQMLGSFFHAVGIFILCVPHVTFFSQTNL